MAAPRAKLKFLPNWEILTSRICLKTHLEYEKVNVLGCLSSVLQGKVVNLGYCKGDAIKCDIVQFLELV